MAISTPYTYFARGPIGVTRRARRDSFPEYTAESGGSRTATSGTGFTLIEMMIVIAISAIILATLVPNFTPAIERTKLHAAARDIASALRHCRGYAMIRGEDAIFEIDTSKNTYQITGRKKVYQIPESIELSLFTTTTETLSDHVGRIRFFPDGSATGGRVTLIGKNQTLVIDVNWLTGEIKLGDKDEVDQEH